MAGGGALNLSLLSRGVGEVQTNGHEKVEVFLEPEDYYNFRNMPHRYYFPPIKHNYTLVQESPQPTSRDARDTQEIHLPKTFTTRKGALLIFSEDLALKDSERDHTDQGTAKSEVDAGAETAVNLRTVDDLAKSILSYGNHDGNKVYMKFLHRKRARTHRQIRPGFSAKRYLATWTRSWDDSVLETVIKKGYITERSLFQYNFVIPHLRRRIFHEDLSHYPPPYRLMRNMLLSPGSLSGYTFYRAVPEFEDILDEYRDGDIDRESIRSRPPTSIKVIRTRDGIQREVSYKSLDKKSQEEVITDLLVKSAVHYALRKQQEFLVEDIEEMEEANADIHAPAVSEGDRKVSSSLRTPVPQFDMKEAVESLLDSHRHGQLDTDFPAVDNQSHSSDYGGSFRGSAIPTHAVKGHSAKTHSWPYGIDEAGKEYIGIAPVVSLREGSSSPSLAGSTSSIPQLPAIKRHPLTPIRDVSRETSRQTIQLPPLIGPDGLPAVNIEPPTPQQTMLLSAAGDAVKETEEEWNLTGKTRRKHGLSSSVESLPQQSIPSKNRPHWKGSQHSLRSLGSKKGRVDFEKYSSAGSAAQSETASLVGDGSVKGSIICAPDGEIISVGGSVGPSTRPADVAPLQDVLHVNRRVGDGDTVESIPSDADEPDEWRQSRKNIHIEAAVEPLGKRKHKVCSDGLERGFESDWENIAENPEEEALAIMDSREAIYPTPRSNADYGTPAKHTTLSSRESTFVAKKETDSVVTKQSQRTSTTSSRASRSDLKGMRQSVTSKRSERSKLYGENNSQGRSRSGHDDNGRDRPESGVHFDEIRSSSRSKSRSRSRSIDNNNLKRKDVADETNFNKVRTNLSQKSKGKPESESKPSNSVQKQMVDKATSSLTDDVGRFSVRDEEVASSGFFSQLTRMDTLNVSREPTHRSASKSDLNSNRSGSRYSDRSERMHNESFDEDQFKADIPRQRSRESSSRSQIASDAEYNKSEKGSYRRKSGRSVHSENELSPRRRAGSSGSESREMLLPSIPNQKKSLSAVSRRTSTIAEERETPVFSPDRSRSEERPGTAVRRTFQRSSSQDSFKESTSSAKSHSLSDTSVTQKISSTAKELVPPLDLFDKTSESEILTSAWEYNQHDNGNGFYNGENAKEIKGISGGQSDASFKQSSRSKSQTSLPSAAAGILLEPISCSQLDDQLLVSRSQTFLPSAPTTPNVHTQSVVSTRSVKSFRSSKSTLSRLDADSAASEQFLVDALTEHAHRIAQSVLSQSEAGMNLEADIRRAAHLWTDQHPTRDLSRSQSVQDPPNTDAIEEIMKHRRPTSEDLTAANYREEIRRNLTTAVAKATGLSPDSLPRDAEISPELLDALASQSLSPDDIELVHDEESGQTVLRSKSQMSKAMGGVKEGHIFVSPGAEDKPPISIPSERASVKDVGEVDIISYGVPETGDVLDAEQRSKASSKPVSIIAGEVDDTDKAPEPSIAEPPAPVEKPEEPTKIDAALPPDEPTVESREDTISEHGSTKTGISKVSQKSEESKKSREGKVKKPVPIADREEFVVGKVEKKNELEQLYGPVEPPPLPKQSPPKLSPIKPAPPKESEENKKPEIVVPVASPVVEQESPSKASEPTKPSTLDIPPFPQAPSSVQNVSSPPKTESPLTKMELPTKAQPAPPPAQMNKPSAASTELPPLKKETKPPVKKEEAPAAKKPPSKPESLPPLKKSTSNASDRGRVDPKGELANLYSQIPPAPPPKEVKGKPRTKPKAEKPVKPPAAPKKKEKKVKKKKEPAPPPPKQPSPPPVPKAASPVKQSPEPDDTYAPSPAQSEEMEFVFVREQSETPESTKPTPVPLEPTPPPPPAPIEEIPEEEDEDTVQRVSMKDARLAKRLAAAAKKREEVDRRRREKEEEIKRKKEEEERQEQLRREMEEERKRREEERRLRKLHEEEENNREEQAALDRERRRQQELERERRAKEEYQRKLEEMRRKQQEEEQRRIEAMLQRQREEEERRRQEEEMMSKMAEQERHEYEQRKREEEELRRQREEEEKRRREEEAQRALEEAKRLAEEMARRKAELEARLRFNRNLQLESHGLSHTQDITKMFVFSYFELLQWLGLDIPEFELQKLAQF